MDNFKIVSVRAYTSSTRGADYHSHSGYHWIDDHVATPMAKYPEYRESRSSWGLNALGSVIVEVESESGHTGVGVSTGGVPAAWIIENHLSRFIEGQRADKVEQIWDQMFLSTIYYGRKGITLNAISAVDLAIWDLLGKIREEPVYHLLGGKVRPEIEFYATTARPDIAKELGFLGGKMPLLHGPAEGEEGMEKNIERMQSMRDAVGDDFWLMYDCWMCLDLNYAQRLVEKLSTTGMKWLEEAFLPDDYWSLKQLRATAPKGMWVTGGEHEATLQGFRMMLEMECVDILQPDVGWCGGLTELVKIGALADEHKVLVVPHGSSVYSYHYVITQHNSPFAEFLVMSPQADHVIPMFEPLLLGEPVPENGRLKVSDRPGFGVELNRDVELERPFVH